MSNLSWHSEQDYEAYKHVLPAYSLEAEQTVIGSLLLENGAFEQIEDIFSADDFYLAEHKKIFKIIARMLSENQPVDVLSLHEEMLRNGLPDKGSYSLSYLVDLAQNAPSSANIKKYAEIIRDRSVLRQLRVVGQEITAIAGSSEGRPIAELLEDAEKKVFEISEKIRSGKLELPSMHDLIKKVIIRIDELYSSDNDGNVISVPTGFLDLDKKTSGLQRGDLIIVAGRPSMGKTAFAINIAEHVGIREKKPVLIFSMAMSQEQICTRMISSLGRIDSQALRTGRLADTDWQNLNNAITLLDGSPIHVDETPGLSISELRTRARRIAAQHRDGLGLIVIDYIQLMSGSNIAENRTGELAEISRGLKALARELNTPIITLSQLSRAVEQRTNKRPLLSDLRESGAIEQDADLIMFMYRDEYYNPDSRAKGYAECIIGKHRNGPTGTVYLQWTGKYTRFDNTAYLPDNLGDFQD